MAAVAPVEAPGQTYQVGCRRITASGRVERFLVILVMVDHAPGVIQVDVLALSDREITLVHDFLPCESSPRVGLQMWSLTVEAKHHPYTLRIGVQLALVERPVPTPRQRCHRTIQA